MSAAVAPRIAAVDTRAERARLGHDDAGLGAEDVRGLDARRLEALARDHRRGDRPVLGRDRSAHAVAHDENLACARRRRSGRRDGRGRADGCGIHVNPLPPNEASRRGRNAKADGGAMRGVRERPPSPRRLGHGARPTRGGRHSRQVFGLAGVATGRRVPTGRRFPGRRGPPVLRWRLSFLLTAAGAVPDLRRVPFSARRRYDAGEHRKHPTLIPGRGTRQGLRRSTGSSRGTGLRCCRRCSPGSCRSRYARRRRSG